MAPCTSFVEMITVFPAKSCPLLESTVALYSLIWSVVIEKSTTSPPAASTVPADDNRRVAAVKADTKNLVVSLFFKTIPPLFK